MTARIVRVAMIVAVLFGCRREQPLIARGETLIITSADVTPGETTTVSVPINTMGMQIRVHASGANHYRTILRDEHGKVLAEDARLEFPAPPLLPGSYRVEVEGDGKPLGVAILDVK